MRERQTVVLLHPGPGFDHGLFKVQLGPWLSAGTQVVYTDLRGAGRSDRSTPAERHVERWADDVKELCDAVGIVRPVVLGLGFGSVVALKYAARHPEHPAGARARGADRPCDPGTVDRHLRATGWGGRPGRRGAVLRRHGRAGIRGLPACVLPAPLQLRAHERRDRARRLEPRGADGVDARRGEASSTCATSSRRFALLRSFSPERRTRGRRSSRCRRSTSCSAGTSASAAIRTGGTPSSAMHPRLRRHASLPRRHPGAGDALVKVAVNGVELFFDVEGAKVRPGRPLDAGPPDRDPAADGPRHGPLALQGAARAGARGGRAGDLPRPARSRPERLELTGALDARHLDRRSDRVLRDARGASGRCSSARGSAASSPSSRRRGDPISSTGSCSSAPSPAIATRGRSPSSTGSAGPRPGRSRRDTTPTRRSSTSPSSCASACRSSRGRRCRPTQSRGSR